MTLNQAGIELIKYSEGCSLRVYKDAVGLPTVGYGHMDRTLQVGATITQDEAEEMLQQDLLSACKKVSALLHETLTDNQFSALVSFAFNLGVGALAGSTLLKLVNNGQYPEAADQFLLWDHAGGKVLPGLTVRRQAERELFLT